MRNEEYIKRMEDWHKKSPVTFSLDEGEFVFDEGEFIEVFDANQIFNDTDLTGQPFPEFIKEAAKHFGEDVEIEGNTVILVGIAYSYRDWYYIVDDTEDRFYETCVSKIKFLENLDN